MLLLLLPSTTNMLQGTVNELDWHYIGKETKIKHPHYPQTIYYYSQAKQTRIGGNILLLMGKLPLDLGRKSRQQAPSRKGSFFGLNSHQVHNY